MGNERLVVFAGDQKGLCEDLFRCKENGKMYIRQFCDDEHVRWLTSSKWSEGYEADCPLREGLVMEIIDSSGNLLFRESIIRPDGYMDTVAKKIAPFSWEAVSEISEEFEKSEHLKSHDDWLAWIMEDANKYGHKGCWENWAFGKIVHGNIHKLKKISILGREMFLTEREENHSVSEKKWRCFEIRSKDLTSVEDICGYLF